MRHAHRSMRIHIFVRPTYNSILLNESIRELIILSASFV